MCVSAFSTFHPHTQTRWIKVGWFLVQMITLIEGYFVFFTGFEQMLHEICVTFVVVIESWREACKNPSLFVDFLRNLWRHAHTQACFAKPWRHSSKLTQLHTKTLTQPPSTLLFNRYCIDVKSKFYTRKPKTKTNNTKNEAKNNNQTSRGNPKREKK